MGDLFPYKDKLTSSWIRDNFCVCWEQLIVENSSDQQMDLKGLSFPGFPFCKASGMTLEWPFSKKFVR